MPKPAWKISWGGGASDSELFRSGAAGAPNIPESARAARAWRDSAESSLPAGTGSESDFHVSPERRAIIFPVSRKEQNNDLRDLLISQQVRRIDELDVRSTCSRPCCTAGGVRNRLPIRCLRNRRIQRRTSRRIQTGNSSSLSVSNQCAKPQGTSGTCPTRTLR